MAGKIFINYRRGVDQAAAGRLYDQLEKTFLKEQLFMDVDSVPPGEDFQRELESQIAECDVFLSVIGRNWSDVRDVSGRCRLEDPNDWVRIEIESALKHNKTVIPVLVNDA
jgi:hypothetical protein